MTVITLAVHRTAAVHNTAATNASGTKGWARPPAWNFGLREDRQRVVRVDRLRRWADDEAVEVPQLVKVR